MNVQVVPLMMSGVEIGTVRILPDNSMQVIMHPGNPVVRELRLSLQQGLYTGVSIQPVIDSSLADKVEPRDVLPNRGRFREAL